MRYPSLRGAVYGDAAPDEAEREQNEFIHIAEPRGGKPKANPVEFFWIASHSFAMTMGAAYLLNF